MRKYILILQLLISLGAMAQARFSSNKETHSFGQIEWKKPVTVEFIISNPGNKPLVLSNVSASCGCTEVTWTQSPINPKENGVVKVTFDAKMLGHFVKNIDVYSNATPNLTSLFIDGEVVREVRDFTRTHPFKLGHLRIDRDSIGFSAVRKGKKLSTTMNIVNLSNGVYEPSLMHLPSYLNVEYSPKILLKGEKGTIKVSLDSKKVRSLGLTDTYIYLSRFSGDKVSKDNRIPLTVMLLPNDKVWANPSEIALSDTIVDFTEHLRSHSKAKKDITITNKGKSKLKIYKIQVFHPAVSVSLKESSIAPLESTRLRISFNKKKFTKTSLPLKVILITNDPKRPKIEMNIKH